MSFPLFLALKYLKPKRSVTSIITIFTILGVILGVAIMIIVRAIMTGFGDMWHEKLLAFKPHLTITSRHDSRINNEDDLCRAIESVPGVTSASPAIETRVLVEFNQRVLAPIVIGVDPASATNILPSVTNMRAGVFDLEGDSILIGTEFATALSLHVGDKLLVYSPMNLVHKDEIYFPEELVVRGIFSTGQNQFDSDFAITSLALARDLVGLESGVYSIYVKTDNPQNQRIFSTVINAVVNRIGVFKYNIRNWQEIDRELFNALAVEKNMMSILLAFITIVAIFCVTVTLIVITVQKTNEIGLLKALGFSSGQILLTFVLYGWVQCVAGTIFGIGAAYLVLHNLQRVIDYLGSMGVQVFARGIYGLDALPWRVVPGEVLEVILLVFFVSTLFCTLFAWRAARLDPIDALRKE